MSCDVTTEPCEIWRLDHFQPALATDFSGRGPQREFGTLLVPCGASRNGSGPHGGALRVRTPNGRSYALKLLSATDERGDGDARLDLSPAGLASEREMRERLRMAREKAFLEEYRCHVAVSHLRGFPQVYGIGTVEGTPAILMEWVEGTTLEQAHELLEGDAGRIARLGVAVLDVLLGTLSLDAPFIHRDLSPWNILVSGLIEGSGDFKPEVTLVDFGSSSFEPVQSPTFTMRFDIWRGGTAEYAAPEMLTQDIAGIERLRTSPTIDTYALCSVLFELLCGRAPFMVALRPGASAYRIKMDEKPERIDLGSRRDNDLEDLLLRGIVAEQESRYGVSELRAALQAWLAPSA